MLNVFHNFYKTIILKDSYLNVDELVLTKTNFVYVYFSKVISKKNSQINFYKNKFKRSMLYTIYFSKWFSKKNNMQKLYFKAHIYFLSSGMVVNTFKRPFKFLKKRVRIWNVVAKWYKKLFLFPTILWLNNLYGYKLNLLKLFMRKKVYFFSVFVQFFFLNFIFIKKKKKRIKRWIKKKYFSVEVDKYRVI